MRILITGSEGFLGSNLTQFLNKRGFNFYSLGLKKLKRNNHFQISSILNEKEIRKVLDLTKPEIIFHLAGSPLGTYEELESINFKFSKTLIKSITDNSLTRVKILLLGTAAEYGLVKEKDLPITEDHLANPISNYGITKLKQTQYVADSAIESIIVRPFNIYGPGMPNYLSISNFINQIKDLKQAPRSKKKYLDVGNLEVMRDFMYVEDFIKTIWELSQTENAYGQVFNLCSGKPLSLKKIVEYMITLSGEDITIRQEVNRMRKDDMRIHFGDNSKVMSMLGTAYETNWKAGIKEMFDE